MAEERLNAPRASANTLWLVRHGEALGYSDSGRDAERALSPLADRQAAEMLPWLQAQAMAAPTLLLHSAARRTTQTAARLADGWQLPADRVVAEQSLYLASAQHLAATVASLPNEFESVAVVGHNPGISQLASQLANRVDLALPTFGCAVFTGEADWLAWDLGDGFGYGSTQLLAHHAPADFANDSERSA